MSLSELSGDASEFPKKGADREQILADIAELRTGDAKWRSGKTFSLIYNTADHDLEKFLEEVTLLFAHENALNPFAFPSHAKMEREVVNFTLSLLHGSDGAGTMTSGGTESIMMAVKTARDHARDALGIAEPQIITATTAHPAFAKAAHYLDIEHIRTPIGADFRADVAAMEQAITDRTALLVGSAINYPYGTIDPIPAIAGLAASKGILCHVDGCLGGWMLPFWERLGEEVDPWDFRVDGVTSISADVHKYGYALKGASTVLYRDPEMVKKQYFLLLDWEGGIYGSPAAAGARPAAPGAVAWATIRYLGEEGYLRLAGRVRDATRRIQAGIAEIDGIEVTGTPAMSVFEFRASDDSVDISAVGDQMHDRGWKVDRQPTGLHLMLSPVHAEVADTFLQDLAEAVKNHGESRGEVASYGGIG